MALDVDAYLERIAFPGRPEVDLPSLAALQRAHLGAVPFENLDVFHGRPVSTGAEHCVAKVLGGRGGWCFELNGAFAALLRAIGFEVDLIGATVVLDEDRSPQPDHLTLIVHLDRRYLVDVGFGVATTQPVPLEPTTVIPEDHGSYRVISDGAGGYALQFAELPDPADPSADPNFSSQFEFGTEPREHGDFADISRHLATTPGLHWSQRRLAVRLIPGGRVSLLEDQLRIRRNGRVEITDVAADDWADVLHDWFGMTL